MKEIIPKKRFVNFLPFLSVSVAFTYKVKQITYYLLSVFKRSALLLTLFATVLLLLELFIPGIYTFVTSGGDYDGRNLLHVAFYLACTLLFFLFLPLMSNRFFYQEKLNQLGWSLPKNKISAFGWMILALILMMPMIWWLAKMPIFQAYYSLHKLSHTQLAFAMLTILPIYYVCEEFFFRGFLFLNLWKRVGWHSYWITDILFVFGHTGKPFLEIIIALPVGIILAWLTLKTKSIYPAMIVHYVLGMMMLLVVNQVI